MLGLCFKDMMEHPLMENLVRAYSKIYGVFGGSHHSVHATFKRNSKLHNNGNYVGLYRPSATRMGGYIIAFLRLMASKAVFDSTMAAPEYSKLKINNNLTELLKHHTFWALILCVVKANFGPLWLLRLADSKAACMDKVVFYVHQTDALVEEHMESMNEFDDPEHESMQQVTDLFDSVLNITTNADNDDGIFTMVSASEDAEPMDNMTTNASLNRLGVWMKRCCQHRRKKLIHPV